MRASFGISILIMLLCCTAYAGQVDGEVLDVSDGRIIASFPVPVNENAMMIILSGDGEAVAGMAIADKCRGDGPYKVYASLSFVADVKNLTPGKLVYVNSSNVGQVSYRPRPATVASQPVQPVSRCPLASTIGRIDRDLKLYYYAAGQTVGYGALGLGYNRTIWVTRGVGVEIDGGIAALGNVNDQNPKIIDTDQIIKTAIGRVKFDFAPGLGFYAGYRWSQGRGSDSNWQSLANKLTGAEFVAPSDFAEGIVEQQGMEYGISLRSAGALALTVGYIPAYRTDFGSLGVLSEPAYTGELRIGGGRSVTRLRGLKTENYWQADLGITIR